MDAQLTRFEHSLNLPSPLISISVPIAEKQNISLFIKRDDLIHPLASGNKWRKLKFILNDFLKSGKKKIITFGGVHSNHLHAISFVCKSLNIDLIAITRGVQIPKTPTLTFLVNNGHTIKGIKRDDYRKLRENPDILLSEYPNAYLIKEGGKDNLAIPGVKELIMELPKDIHFDYFLCACGTGTTIASIAHGLPRTKCIGFYSFKKPFLKNEIDHFSRKNFGFELSNLELNGDYNFGGFGKGNDQLHDFMNQVYLNYKIPLDPIYNAKTFYGFLDMLNRGFFQANSNILILHSGGLQGLEGYRKRYQYSYEYH